MKRITLAELKTLPTGSFICRTKDDGETPTGGVYVWHGTIEDNNLFGYAVHLVANGYAGDWEEGLCALPSRFYFHNGAGAGWQEGAAEKFYVYTRTDLSVIAEAISKAMTIPTCCEVEGEGGAVGGDGGEGVGDVFRTACEEQLT